VAISVQVFFAVCCTSDAWLINIIFPIILVTIYLLRAGFSELTYQNELNARKVVWEERNAYILKQIEQGNVDISVKGVDSIETIMDFNPVCFRDFYQIDIISITD